MKLPFFIIVRDRLTCTRKMVEYLNQEETGCYPIILDNQSTNPELLSWYETEPCIIHRIDWNAGNCVLFSDPRPEVGKPNFFELYDCTQGYLLSDCDIEIWTMPTNFVSVFQNILNQFSWATKVGSQLKISDLPNTSVAREAKGWEQLNHSASGLIGDNLWKSPIDTTVALYKWMDAPNTALAHDFNGSIRVGGSFECRHLPWYFSKENPPPPDELYYLAHITSDFNHYSIRLRQMLEE